MTVAALVTDDPPTDAPLIAANAWARVNDPSTADVFLVIDNRSDQADALVGASSTSAPDATVGMIRLVQTGVFPYTTVDIPAGNRRFSRQIR